METAGGLETTRIILGLYWGHRKEYMGLYCGHIEYRDNGKENGNYF